MATTTIKDYITFSNGINTETNYIKEEEGTCSDISNFRINKDGSLEKRGGFLPAHPLVECLTTVDKPQSFLWKNVAGNPNLNFYVIKQATLLMFFDANKEFNETNKLNFSVDLAPFITTGHDTSDFIKVQMADGEGLLFVAGKIIEPIVIKYNIEAKRMDAKKIAINIRDYVGLDDGITDISEYPQNYSNVLVYNLTNQGFSESDIAQYYSENGCLPAKVDVPKNFKYIKVSTDVKEPKKPEEVYDYQLSFENNFGTSRAPIGRKILDVFSRSRSIGSSSVGFSISISNLFDAKFTGSTAIFTFKTNRVPDIPLNTFFEADVEQSGFIARFPETDAPWQTDTVFGTPVTRQDQTPMIVTWTADTSDIERRGIAIFEDADVNWDAYDGMTEAEYKAHSFRTNNCIVARHLGETNEYVIIYNNDRYGDYVKQNLVDKVGGVVNQDFQLDGNALNLQDNEKGKYLKITTNAKADYAYFNRIGMSKDFPLTIKYDKTIVDFTGKPIEVIETIGTYPVKCELTPSTDRVYAGKIRMKFISETLCQLHVSSRFTSVDENYDLNNPLPPGFSGYRFNSFEDTGKLMYGLEDIFSQLKIRYRISDQPIQVGKDSEQYRPEAIAFYANRVFYSAYNSEEYSNHVFYSQIEDLENNAGKCYTRNDPTSEYENMPLDTDGGYLTIPEADNILNLVVVKDKLLILARNSVYAVFGDPFFKATSYAIRKVSDIGIVSPDAYAIVGETIVFASDDGLYNFNIDELSGDLVSNNFSNARIKTLYNSLTEEQKKNIKINYNPFEKKLSVMLTKSKLLAPDVYDTILHYDFDLQCFYKYDIDQYGNNQIIDFFEEYIYNKSRPNSLFVYDNNTGNYGTLTENKNTFRDFNIANNPYTCALESNYINFNDVIRTKQVRRLKVYADNERDSYCEAFVKYDSSLVPTSKWSKSEEVFRLQAKTNGTVHMHQQVCRGSGLFFKIRFESNQEKPCKLLGWTLQVEGNQQI